MKIDVFFKDYHLGVLTSKDNEFIYNSDLQGEKNFKENAVSAMFYGLFDSANLQLKALPYYISEYLDLQDNEFICRQVNINKSDSDFEKLYKLSLLKFDDIGFYIGQKE